MRLLDKACIQEILEVCREKANLNNFNSEHASIYRNLKNLLCQLINLSKKINMIQMPTLKMMQIENKDQNNTVKCNRM